MSIDVSGGSNNKKYLLSPLQLRLSLFLSAVYGGSLASSEVKNSFHRERTLETVKGIDYSSKKRKKKIIDLIKSNEIFKDRILNESLLFKDMNDIFDSKMEENSKVGEIIESVRLEEISNNYPVAPFEEMDKEEVKVTEQDRVSKQEVDLDTETENKVEGDNSKISLDQQAQVAGEALPLRREFDCLTEGEKDVISSGQSENLNTHTKFANLHSKANLEEISSHLRVRRGSRKFHTSAYQFYSKDNLVNSDLSISLLPKPQKQSGNAPQSHQRSDGLEKKTLTSLPLGRDAGFGLVPTGQIAIKKEEKHTSFSSYINEVKQIVLEATAAVNDEVKRREAQLKFEES